PKQILFRKDEKKLATLMHDFSGDIQQPVPQRSQCQRVALLRQAAAVEPSQQIPGQLSDQQPGPVSVKFVGRQLFKTEIVLMFLNQVLHRATPERPAHYLLGGAPQVVADHHVITPLVLFALLIKAALPLSEVALRRVTG